MKSNQVVQGALNLLKQKPNVAVQQGQQEEQKQVMPQDKVAITQSQVKEQILKYDNIVPKQVQALNKVQLESLSNAVKAKGLIISGQFEQIHATLQQADVIPESANLATRSLALAAAFNKQEIPTYVLEGLGKFLSGANFQQNAAVALANSAQKNLFSKELNQSLAQILSDKSKMALHPSICNALLQQAEQKDCFFNENTVALLANVAVDQSYNLQTRCFAAQAFQANMGAEARMLATQALEKIAEESNQLGDIAKALLPKKPVANEVKESLFALAQMAEKGVEMNGNQLKQLTQGLSSVNQDDRESAAFALNQASQKQNLGNDVLEPLAKALLNPEEFSSTKQLITDIFSKGAYKQPQLELSSGVVKDLVEYISYPRAPEANILVLQVLEGLQNKMSDQDMELVLNTMNAIISDDSFNATVLEKVFGVMQYTQEVIEENSALQK